MRNERGFQDNWTPRTKLGEMVAQGTISLEEIFKQGMKIKEAEIVDMLLPQLRNDLIFIGDSPGKGGGGRKTPTKRTVKMHRSGRRYKISALVIVGTEGYIGIGKADSKEHSQAIAKALKAAKLNIIPVKRGCGSWECRCADNHSIPFEVTGKAGSVSINLLPAPKGIGLCISDEAKKILEMAGVKDIWSKAFGDTRTRTNYVVAVYNALKNLNSMKVHHEFAPESIKQTIEKADEQEIDLTDVAIETNETLPEETEDVVDDE
ncbi:MAG: 30S ribosomal protein S5 [Candidatus Aenigmatarchaeota archaeon]